MDPLHDLLIIVLGTNNDLPQEVTAVDKDDRISEPNIFMSSCSYSTMSQTRRLKVWVTVGYNLGGSQTK